MAISYLLSLFYFTLFFFTNKVITITTISGKINCWMYVYYVWNKYCDVLVCHYGSSVNIVFASSSLSGSN
uniref:Putative ovule protein n=1 Tax=Solanum chacoense TaxID=4108 RepID=A0A0V0IDE0_SOLCH